MRPTEGAEPVGIRGWLQLHAVSIGMRAPLLQMTVGLLMVAAIGLAAPDVHADAARQQEASKATQRGDAATAARLIEAEVKALKAAKGERDPQTLTWINN